MNRRKAAPALVIGSLAVLLSGCAGAAAQSQVNDNLKPLANAAAVGLARGHVIEKNDFSSQPFSADAIRELKGSAPVTVERPFSAEAIGELKGNAPVAESAADMQSRRLSAYAEAYATADVTAADMQGRRLSAYAEALSDAAKRELKGSAPVEVNDYLSPLGGSR